MTIHDSLERAVAMMARATALDMKEDYESAFKCYTEGLEWFMQAMLATKSSRLRRDIRSKMGEYMERAELIKNLLQQQRGAAGTHSQPASHSPSPSPKPNTISDNNNNNNNNNSKSRGDADLNHNGQAPGNSSSSSSSSSRELPDDARIMQNIQHTILQGRPNVRWDDVAGLEAAKEALKEAVVLPIRFPQLFQGKRKPWKGILLYGPPGTGKTHLARAVATESNATFFSLSSADLVSKWQGESAKNVRALFTMARKHAPSVIFIDEIDALCSERSDSEQDQTTRIKTELLVQMQGVMGQEQDGVLVLAATNMPGRLDKALRRRMERRIYISLPDDRARRSLLSIHLKSIKHKLTAEQLNFIAATTGGMSGSDIEVMVHDAIMQPIRRIQRATHFRRLDTPQGVAFFTPCESDDEGVTAMHWEDIDNSSIVEPIVTYADFLESLKRTKSTVSERDLQQYITFTKSFGQEG